MSPRMSGIPLTCLRIWSVEFEAAQGHTPVLPREVSEFLAVQPSDTVLDVTVGLGGHARLFTDRLDKTGTLVGLDADPENLAIARRQLAGATCRVELVHANFVEARRVLASLGLTQVDALFADLGVSSTQLDQGMRGFSFLRDGPLDMRMDPRLTTTAAELVNGLKERELSDLFYYHAQETASRRIAHAICEARKDSRITTTGRLARIIAEAVHVDPLSRKSKTHPATRTFLALRMAVNDETPSLQTLLDEAPKLLRPGGRIALIAFHSVEDKLIKMDFRRQKSAGVYQIVTKKPVVADEDERRSNPRSRSAKLRVALRASTGA